MTTAEGASAGTNQPNLQRLTALVLTLTRQGPLIETAAGRWLLQGAPATPPGTSLEVELPANASRTPQSGRLVAVDGRALDPSVGIRLTPASTAHQSEPSKATARPTPPAGVDVVARLVGSDGRVLGRPAQMQLTVANTPLPAPVDQSSSPATASQPARVAPIPAPTTPAALTPTSRTSATATSAPGTPTTSAPGTSAPAIGSGTAAPSPTAAPPGTNAPTATAAAPAPPAPMMSPRVVAASGDRATVSSAPVVLPTPAGAVSSPQAAVTAEVTARDALGRLFLRAAGMTLRVDEALDLPIGARLQLVLPAAAGSPAHAGVTSGDAKPDVIERALAELFHIRPSADRTLDAPQARPLPPDTSLAARLLRLVGALPTTSPGAAEATPETENAAPTMTNRGLGNASPELGRPGSEASLGGWRVLTLPFGLEDPLGLRLYVREDPGDGERSNQGQHDEPSPQRAIFELDFSHVGRCQVDVLCQGKRFDLILRTKAALDPNVQTEIRALFVAARDAAGWGGEISFRADDLVSLPTPTTPIRPVTA